MSSPTLTSKTTHAFDGIQLLMQTIGSDNQVNPPTSSSADENETDIVDTPIFQEVNNLFAAALPNNMFLSSELPNVRQCM